MNYEQNKVGLRVAVKEGKSGIFAGWVFTIWLCAAYFELLLSYENVGVSADGWFAVLECDSYSEVSESKGLTRSSSLRFPCYRGFLRLDFVKLTGYALDAVLRAARRGIERLPVGIWEHPILSLDSRRVVAPRLAPNPWARTWGTGLFALKRLPTLCPSPHQKPHFLL